MKTIISAVCLVAWTALAFLSASAHAQEVRRAIPVVTPVPNSPLLTPEGTDKIIREVFANGHFSNLILLDHDAVFTPYKPHRTREMDLYDLRTLIEDGQDRAHAERSLQAFSRPFFAAKVIYGINRGYGYSQGPFEMMLTVTLHTGGYTWKYYRNYADFMETANN